MPAGEITFTLDISAEQYLRYYRGTARHVVARGRDGRTVKFPAGLLRPFVTHDGVHGDFLMRYGENNRVISLERCAGAGRSMR